MNPNETPASGAIRQEQLHQRIGVLTRTLHDALRELGYDRELQHAHANLPDTRDRLEYVTRLTGEAADKVLNAVDSARNVQEELATQSRAIALRWGTVDTYTAKGGRATPAGAELVADTRNFCERIGQDTERTNAILTEIMLAQDFHDLTGQVIRRVLTVAEELEANLVKLLIETAPAAEFQAPGAGHAGPSGPVVRPEERHDVVSNQAQVDDLLAQLGF